MWYRSAFSVWHMNISRLSQWSLAYVPRRHRVMNFPWASRNPTRMPGRYDADRCLDPTTLAGRCRIPWILGNGVLWKVCKVSSCLIILCAFGHTCSHVPTISHCFGWKPNAQVETSIFEGANFAFQNRGLRKVQVDARSCRYLHQAWTQKKATLVFSRCVSLQGPRLISGPHSLGRDQGRRYCCVRLVFASAVFILTMTYTLLEQLWGCEIAL